MTRFKTLGLLLCWGLLAACASTNTVLHEEVEAQASSWQEACEDARSLIVLCGEDVCALYRCVDVMPGRIVRTFSGASAVRPPLPAPGGTAMRYWGSAQGLPRNTEPVFVISWYNDKSQRQLPAWCEQQRKEAEELARKPRVKHHIFPQEFKEWFKEKGINVHEWTLVLLQDDHERIHLGPRGGPWNAAWRRYKNANPDAQREAIMLYAGELIYRFELFGPVIPYYKRQLSVPCVPQL